MTSTLDVIQNATSSLHQTLSDASAAFSAAQAEVAQASDLVERARGFAAAAQRKHDDSQTVQQDVKAWKLRTFKSGSAEPIPPDLLEARREAIYAGEEAEHATDLLKQLETELAAAQQVAEAANFAKLQSANEIVLGQADEIVTQLNAVRREHDRLRLILFGLAGGIQAPTAEQQNRLAHAVNELLNEVGLELRMTPRMLQGVTSHAWWRAYNEALLEHSGSSVPALPELEELVG